MARRDRDESDSDSETASGAAHHVATALTTGGQGDDPVGLARAHARDMIAELVTLAKTSKRATVRLQAARTILEIASTPSADGGNGASGGVRVIVVTQSEAEAAANMLAQRKALPL